MRRTRRASTAKMLRVLLACIFVCTISKLAGASEQKKKSIRVYTDQFPLGSEHLKMPPTVIFSVYMGKLKYPHLPLLLESMRLNPQVTFQLINVIEDGSKDTNDIIALGQKQMVVDNFKVKTVTISELRERVRDRLKIDVEFDKTWYYKMCDYKPTMAYLFPELASNQTYKYWGYGDIDVIWGNFSRFSHWFQGDYQFIISGWFGTTGAAAFYPLEDWSTSLFMDDPKYVPLLTKKTYHNLDEGGTQTTPENVVDGGSHSISEIQKRRMSRLKLNMNRGQTWKDHCFIDAGDSYDWAGPVVWHRGSLKIVHGSPEFPPGRELLFFHRPELRIDFPEAIRNDIFNDMMQYGYLLPNWVPLYTKYACRKAGASGSDAALTSMAKYQPYDSKCFGVGPHHHKRMDVLESSSEGENK